MNNDNLSTKQSLERELNAFRNWQEADYNNRSYLIIAKDEKREKHLYIGGIIDKYTVIEALKADEEVDKLLRRHYGTLPKWFLYLLLVFNIFAALLCLASSVAGFIKSDYLEAVLKLVFFICNIAVLYYLVKLIRK